MDVDGTLTDGKIYTGSSEETMNTIVEVLIFAIARGLVVGHEAPLKELLSIACIAILLACRKYLFHEFDFQEEE